MLRVAFLASGNGGTAKFLHEAIEQCHLPIQIVGVIADRQCGALEFAASNGIPNQQISYSRTSPKQLRDSLGELNFDLAVTNFHKIIDEETLNLFQGKFINLHYSLLPAFGAMIGMKTIDAAEQCNAKFIGTTCHRVIPEVDAGEIISQSIVAVDWNSDHKPDLITITFRAACFVFLNSLMASTPITSDVSMLSKKVGFNPELSFNTSPFDDAFWARVSTL